MDWSKNLRTQLMNENEKAAVLVAFWWFTRFSILEFDSRAVLQAKKRVFH